MGNVTALPAETACRENEPVSPPGLKTSLEEKSPMKLFSLVAVAALCCSGSVANAGLFGHGASCAAPCAPTCAAPVYNTCDTGCAPSYNYCCAPKRSLCDRLFGGVGDVVCALDVLNIICPDDNCCQPVCCQPACCVPTCAAPCGSGCGDVCGGVPTCAAPCASSCAPAYNGCDAGCGDAGVGPAYVAPTCAAPCGCN
ncbi:hypothetical protein LzC2_19410 [Planctomycetes bacterium LzC2]|uniref:Uncharacterized protein n=2 Tax=Alienimonas chondri TaxID=2681879 RepID=A0ABX1VEC5_9PLAN|nr:hypothetical protein [Alienimonas chondri]